MHRRLPLFLLLVVTAFAAPAAVPVPAVASAVRPATAAELERVNFALQKTAQDLHRWAYTESRLIRDEKGRVKTDLVIRHDPSKPYSEQWVPISVNGRPPTDSDISKYRRQGERAQRMNERGETDRRRSLGELIEPGKALFFSETADSITFEVPLRKDGNERFPPEKFQVLVRIGRESGALENIAVRLRGSFRQKLVVKVKSGEGTLDFAVIDPKHPPTLTAIRGDASASILFVSIGGEMDLKRTELKHVKPYDERFEVQIGTLKAIDF
jgi:hypothetical protein